MYRAGGTRKAQYVVVLIVTATQITREPKSSAGKADRIPPEAGGIQVNFCKNPRCANYGVPARSTIRQGGTGGGKVQDGYALTSASAMIPLLRCHGCGEWQATADQEQHLRSSKNALAFRTLPGTLCIGPGLIFPGPALFSLGRWKHALPGDLEIDQGRSGGATLRGVGIEMRRAQP
jgi:hypothetical protein